MKIHYIQHVDFETPANINIWAKEKGYMETFTRLYESEAKFPDITEFDFLVVMGGPMNIYEYEKYPWLKEEKNFIKRAVENNKKVLGICLGAQLLADVLGGAVSKNEFKEIGWYDAKLTYNGKRSEVFSKFKDETMVFHWHGDKFDIPPNALRTMYSKVCDDQAFEYNNGKVIGLQFHIEMGKSDIERIIENCRDELVEGKYIMKEEEIRENIEKNIADNFTLLCKVLNKMEEI